MKYRKLKNGKYKIVDMNIITYEEVVMKYFNQNVSMETILKENEFYDEYEIKNPKILESDRKFDFGTGFYLTTSYEQAEKWAVLTVKRRNYGKPFISVFEYDEEGSNELSVLKFQNADEKWLRFVSANRKNLSVKNDYDVVIGPVANDRTMPVISLFFAGVYTEEETVKRLLPQKLKDQIVFKTKKSLQYLKFVEVVEVNKNDK